MAATSITNTVLKLNEFSAMPASSAVDASEGALISFDAPGERCLIIANNSHASAPKTVTIKKGNSIWGVGDISREIAAGATYCCVVESGRFKNVSGANAGKVVVIGTDASIKVSCIVLP